VSTWELSCEGGRADLLKEDITKDSANYRSDGCYATGKEIRIGAEKVVIE